MYASILRTHFSQASSIKELVEVYESLTNAESYKRNFIDSESMMIREPSRMFYVNIYEGIYCDFTIEFDRLDTYSKILCIKHLAVQYKALHNMDVINTAVHDEIKKTLLRAFAEYRARAKKYNWELLTYVSR